MDGPNILFVVWDACRLDVARNEAPTLLSLGDSNLWFENAVAPAPWTIPSHMSMFTGQYAHQHQCYTHSHQLDPSPLLDELCGDGYTCYGVSGNGFLSYGTGFADPFDEFEYTGSKYRLRPEGIGVDQYLVRYARANPDATRADRYRALADAIVGHEHPLQSAVNAGSAVADKVFGGFEFLQSRHPVFTPNDSYSYDSSDNTSHIERVLEREATTSDPFFIFTNYMNTHRPYFPPEKWQREYLGRTLPYDRIRQLNETAAHPWQYIRQLLADELDDGDVETIRQLYAATVRSADEQLGRLLDALERHGLREDTLVVVTADHGENIGETDRAGRTRMGHEASMSEDVLRVPLVVAHPELDARSVTELFSLKELYTLFTDRRASVTDGSAMPITDLITDKVVESQYPALNDEETMAGKYPDIPEEIRKQRSTYHAVAGYHDDVSVEFSSGGDRYAWQGDDETDIEDAPTVVVERCDDHLETLIGTTENDGALSEEERDHLEALGYL